MEIICNNETLILSHYRAVYWPRQKALLLADMHLGKTGYFRSKGIAIPSAVLVADLDRLDKLIEIYQPEKIIIAGDMFHHDYNADIDLFKKWRQTKPGIRFVLVPGNHDKLLNIDYENLSIHVTAATHLMDPFTIIHKPVSEAGTFSISGHIHPGYIMEGRARQSLRLPCFIISHQQLILPAFSLFTGLYTGYPVNESDTYYLIGNDSIYKV